MKFCAASLVLITFALQTNAIADAQNSDPSQWTGHDAYQILTNSPWTRPVKVKFSSAGSDTFGNQTPSPPVGNNPPPSPNMGGGLGRRGMGGGSSSVTYGSGGGRGSSTPTNSKAGPTEVTVQWQSAMVVRMAAARNADSPVAPASFQPLDEYVIAVIGLPITVIGGHAASADSDTSISPADQQRIEDRVKSSASLLRSGHEPITPDKVELDQGKDGRTLIHFSKSEPIEIGDKSVEFRLTTSQGELRKKFPLKEMEFQGKLDL